MRRKRLTRVIRRRKRRRKKKRARPLSELGAIVRPSGGGGYFLHSS